MIAIILAAGTGTRLMPLTKDIPKPLLEIDGITLLERMMKNCMANDVSKFVIVVGHKKERVIEHIGHLGEKYPVRITYVENKSYATSNTACSVSLATTTLDDDILIINGDNVVDKRIIKGLLNTEKTALVIDNHKKLNAESFKIQIKNRIITDIGKEIDINTALGEFIGMSKVSRNDLTLFNSLLGDLIQENLQNYYDLAYRPLSKKANLDYFYTNGLKWTEIDDKDDWEYAQKLVKELNS